VRSSKFEALTYMAVRKRQHETGTGVRRCRPQFRR
jgi:hypothetical protein